MSDPKQIDDGGPAFPCEEGLRYYEGMTLRTYAAIKLRVPESGIDWLDDMIRKAKRDELAGQCDVSAYNPAETFKINHGRPPKTEELAAYISSIRMIEADAMLAARKANR